MSLYLSTKDEGGGVWMEDFKFLAAYKLKPTVSAGGERGERGVNKIWGTPQVSFIYNTPMYQYEAEPSL